MSQLQRKKRVRAKIKAVSTLPRLSVRRTNQHIWAQIIDDQKGTTLAASSDKSLEAKGTKLERAQAVGTAIAELALKGKISNVVFDRGSYRYHGVVKALAEAARAKGLQF